MDTEVLTITPINECGSHRTGTLSSSYREIIKVLGFSENVEDDESKVEASWGFEDQHGRAAFVWCYKQGKKWCTSWSTYGDPTLLTELFGNRFREQ